MNTGFLGPAVATVLTVYGIETSLIWCTSNFGFKLQQYLPFTVLKQQLHDLRHRYVPVATVLTVYGIETH